MKKIMIILMMLSASFMLSAETFIDYLEGYLEIQESGGWEEAYIGDEVSDTAKLRLSDNAYVELTIGDAFVSLTRDGVYEISDLIESSSGVTARGLDLKKKLTLSTDSEKWKHEATMGIRGSEASSSSGTGMEDSFTYLEAGLEMMDAEEYEDALINFEEGWDFFEDPNCLLFTALCYEALGQKRSYVRSLQDVDAEYLEPEFQGIYFARMGDLLIRSLDYSGALNVLGDADMSLLDKDEQQQIHYLLGTAYLGSGSESKAKTSFQKAKSLAPSSDIGRQADQALSSL